MLRAASGGSASRWSVWRASEGHECSTVFTHWSHPDVEDPRSDIPCEFFWSEAHSDLGLRNGDWGLSDGYRDATECKSSPQSSSTIKQYVENVCLQTSRHILYNRFDVALEAVDTARRVDSSRLRFDKDLLGIFLRLSSLVSLVPCPLDSASVSSVRLVPLDALISLEEHSWLLDAVLTAAPICVSRASAVTSAGLVDLLPESMDRGEVYAVNEELKLIASCWRTSAFSQFFNTVKVYIARGGEAEEDSLDLLVSFTPALHTAPNAEYACRISALALSQYGSFLLIASHSGMPDTGEVAVWNLEDSTLIASLSVSGYAVAAEWRCSHSLITLWYEGCGPNGSTSLEPGYLFADWSCMRLYSQSVQQTRDNIARLIRPLPGDSRNSRHGMNLDRATSDFGAAAALTSQQAATLSMGDHDDDLCGNDVMDTVETSLLREEPVDVDLYFCSVVAPLDFSADECKIRELIPGTREWVLRDLVTWLGKPGPGASTDAHASPPTADSYPQSPVPDTKVWLLQSPAGYGKTVIAALIAENLHAQIAAKHFARLGNPSSVDARSFCLSVCSQFCQLLGPAYRHGCLVSLVALARELVLGICSRGSQHLVLKWGLPLLDVCSDVAVTDDHISAATAASALVDAMTARITAISDSACKSAEDMRELSVLCELLSSLQFVRSPGSGLLHLVPLVHSLPVQELFDALVSQPLISSASPASQLQQCNMILLVDGVDVLLDSVSLSGTDSSLILRLIRLIALRSPDWLRIVLTSRCHGGELSEEIDDLRPHVVHLYGEDHLCDIKKICSHLLESKAFTGNIDEGVEVLLHKSDSCIHYIHFLQLYLPPRASHRVLLHMSCNIDIHKFTLVRAFSSEAARSFQRARAVLEVFCASFEPPPASIICAALDIDYSEAWAIITTDLSEILFPSGPSQVLTPHQHPV